VRKDVLVSFQIDEVFFSVEVDKVDLGGEKGGADVSVQISVDSTCS